MKNDYWKEYYEKAPSDNCKKYIRLGFMAELYLNKPDDFKRQRRELEEGLDVTDWEYLYKYAGNNPFRIFCKNKIKEFK